jgi:hypothetical protein
MSAEPAITPARPRDVVARDTHGQPRTHRLAPHPSQQAAYRRRPRQPPPRCAPVRLTYPTASLLSSEVAAA